MKNYHFFTAPWWSEKALFCKNFFTLNIDSDHRSVHLEWFIWVFWEFMMKKMINFLAQWHIRVFLEFKLFWIFWFKLLLRLFGSVFHGSQGSMAKCEEIREKAWFFSGGVMCEKLPFFHSPVVVRKGTFLQFFFFFWISILITGRCIWGGLFVFFENLWWKKW